MKRTVTLRLLGILSLVFAYDAKCQESGSVKNTFSIIHIVEDNLPEYTDSYISKLIEGEYPSNVYSYSFTPNIFKVPVRAEGESAEDFIEQFLQERKFANQLVENDVFRIKNGKFNLDPLYDRIKEESADIYASLANSSNKSPQTDQERAYFNRLIDTRYILVYHHHGLTQKTNENVILGTTKGYEVNQDVYIFKVDLGDNTINLDFWNEGYADANSSEQQIEKARKFREAMVYPFIKQPLNEKKDADLYLKKSMVSEVEGVFDMEKAFNEIFNSGLDKRDRDGSASSAYISSFGGNQLARGIYDINPIQVRIGKEQGIKPNRRFDVYKYVESNKTGELKQRRIGILKADEVSSGIKGPDGIIDPSTFKQIYGWKLDLGDEVRENKQHATLYGGYSSNGLAIRSDFNVGKLGSLIFLDFMFDNVQPGNIDEEIQVEGEGEKTEVSIINIGLGYGKEFYFLNRFSVMPFLAFRYAQASFSDELEPLLVPDEEINTYGTDIAIEGGVRFSVRLNYSLSFAASLAYNTLEFNNPFGEEEISILGASDGIYPLEDYDSNLYFEFALKYDLTTFRKTRR